MRSKSDNIEIMMNDKADEIIEEIFDSLKTRCENNLELMKGSEFVFDYIHLLCYKCHKKSQSLWMIHRFSSLDKYKKSNNKSYQ